MSEIKRYEIWGEYGYEANTQEEPDGEWVRHADHLAAVEAAVMAERAACLAACESFRLACGPTDIDYAIGAFACTEAIRARTTQPAKEAG